MFLKNDAVFLQRVLKKWCCLFHRGVFYKMMLFFTEGFKKWCCFFTEGFMFLFVDLFCRELVVLNSGVLLSAISQRALGREIVNDFAAFRLLEV